VLSPAVDLVSGIVSVLGGQRAGDQTHEALSGVAKEVSSALALGNALNNPGSRGSDRRIWNALSSRPGQERSETNGLTGGHTRTGTGGLWTALAADRDTGQPDCDSETACGRGGGNGLDPSSSAGARAPPALTSGHHRTTSPTTDSPITAAPSRTGMQLPLSDGGTLGVTPTDSPSRDASITPDEANGRYLITAQDAQASNDYHFQLSTPAGSHAVLNRDGGVDLVNPDGQVTQAIAAPWAYDATGKPVPTYFTVQGSTLTQHIQPGPDSIYPILADPAAANSPAPKVGDPGYQGAVHDPDVRDHLDPAPAPAPVKPAPATGTVNSSGVDKVVPSPAPAKSRRQPRPRHRHQRRNPLLHRTRRRRRSQTPHPHPLPRRNQPHWRRSPNRHRTRARSTPRCRRTGSQVFRPGLCRHPRTAPSTPPKLIHPRIPRPLRPLAHLIPQRSTIGTRSSRRRPTPGTATLSIGVSPRLGPRSGH
jgi:hypothetical protein